MSDLTMERARTHGDFSATADCAQRTKDIWRGYLNWREMSPRKREALEMIATKVSRILCGDPDDPDHWRDIGGYSELGECCDS